VAEATNSVSSNEFLGQIPLFESVPEADRSVLAGLWHERIVKRGEKLFRKGESGSSMFIVEEGIIEVSIPGDQGRPDIRVSVVHEGNFFGELSLIDGLPRTATAVAMEDCRLLEMTRPDFLRFLSDRPFVAVTMLGEIGKRLRATNELITNIASRNVNEEMDEHLSFGDRLADQIAEFGGSWVFIIGFTVLLAVWVILNSVQLWFRPFDEYPFIFLNLLLSTVAALQAPVIMMSQNRAQKKDRLRAELDYQVNLKSELMLQQLHAKIDEIRAAELQSMQEIVQVELSLIRRQIENLTTGRNGGGSAPA
jgi:CRP/FNR family transcriptional regulator, cyclic AMP receptor protein